MGNSKTYSDGATELLGMNTSDKGQHADYVRQEVMDKMDDWQTIDDCLDGER